MPLNQLFENVADPGRARADAEEHERGDQGDGEEVPEEPAVVAQPREEELVLPFLVLDPLGLRRRRGVARPGYASIRCRAALAVLRTSGHSVTPRR